MEKMDTYTEAHLFVAAVRILHHQQGKPPKLEDVCSMVQISTEAGHALCRKLEKLDIVKIFQDPFSINLTVANHLQLEQLPREEQDKDALAREIEKFQQKKQSSDQKIAAIQAEMKKKKQDMFADLEARFKKEMNKQKKE